MRSLVGMVLVGAMILAPAGGFAQQPVPVPVPTPPAPAPVPSAGLSQVEGELIGPTSGIAGQPVLLELLTGDPFRMTTTDSVGKFSFIGLPPGEYRLKVEALDSLSRTLVFGPGTQRLLLTLPSGGPVVPVSGLVPGSGLGIAGSRSLDFNVVEWTVESQPLLKDRLIVKAEEGFGLMQIIPIEAGRSLFVFSRGAGASYAFASVPSLSSTLVDAEIRSRTDQPFLGAHRLTSGSNLLLFREIEAPQP